MTRRKPADRKWAQEASVALHLMMRMNMPEILAYAAIDEKLGGRLVGLSA
jgi:hypothetical protein